MYFMLVAKHYRDEEKRENINKNLATWVTGTNNSDRMSKPEVKIHNPTRLPERSHDNILQGIETLSSKWRAYYDPSGDNRPKRLGDPGWNN